MNTVIIGIIAGIITGLFALASVLLAEFISNKKIKTDFKHGLELLKGDFSGLFSEQKESRREGKDKHEGLSKEHEGLSKEHEGLSKEHEGLSKEHEGLSKEVRKSQEMIDSFAREFTEEKTKEQMRYENLTEKQRNMIDAASNIQGMASEIKFLVNENKKMLEENRGLAKEIEALKTQIKDLQPPTPRQEKARGMQR